MCTVPYTSENIDRFEPEHILRNRFPNLTPRQYHSPFLELKTCPTQVQTLRGGLPPPRCRLPGHDEPCLNHVVALCFETLRFETLRRLWCPHSTIKMQNHAALWGLPYMTSKEFWDYLTPSPSPSTKSIPFVCKFVAFFDPSPFCENVIYGVPLSF